ncbi:protein FAN-like isoform X4 [Zophobas morio]|uniref:protein FAN-like isoform X4 n=1 Tax=Zophobas morio TaxID=2755281 RepID=UPI003082F298
MDNDQESYEKRQYGRLKFCSKSLVFDPKEVQYPILRIPFVFCLTIKRWETLDKKRVLLSEIGAEGEVLFVRSKKVIKMREKNVIAPFKFLEATAEYKFTFNYTSLSYFLPLLETLYKCCSLPLSEQKLVYDSILAKKEGKVCFDYKWFEDADEIEINKFIVRKVDAFVISHGRVVLTAKTIYFQPLSNMHSEVVAKYKTRSISRAVLRRYLLQDLGVELYFSTGNSVFYAFRSSKERDLFKEVIDEVAGVGGAEPLREMTRRWQEKEIDNFEYLMYLNSAADRSLNDLTQYPVFPWILTDYTSSVLNLDDPSVYRDLSKPIGALNELRLQLLWERYLSMSEPKFLYGTHYSSPGFVLYYLVRKVPEYMLCLQNGKFDHPDRLFSSVQKTWENVLKSPTDVKELIPEFYDTSKAGDFLVNTQNLFFGVTQDHSLVDDVVLPPWSKDASDFVKTMRAALESEHVSGHLHEWIDLIFGFKQTGEPSVAARNVFYYLTYEGAVDFDSIKSSEERAALEMQISEFGQTPKQLFFRPHPPRLEVVLFSVRRLNFSYVTFERKTSVRTNSITTSGPVGAPPISEARDLRPGLRASDECCFLRERILWDFSRLSFLYSRRAHRRKLTGLCLSTTGAHWFSVSEDGTLCIFNTTNKAQLRRLYLLHLTFDKMKAETLSSLLYVFIAFRIVICRSALSSVSVIAKTNEVVVGSLDGHLYFYSISNGKVLRKWLVHEDAVSCCEVRMQTLVTGSCNADVKIFEDVEVEGDMVKSFRGAYRDQYSSVTCIDLDHEASTFVVGTSEGSISVYVKSASTALALIENAHAGAVYSLALTQESSGFVSIGEDLRFVSWTTGGLRLFQVHLLHCYTCLKYDGQTVIAGTVLGQLDVWDMGSFTKIKTLEPEEEARLECLAVSLDGRFVATGAVLPTLLQILGLFVAGASNGSVYIYSSDLSCLGQA